MSDISTKKVMMAMATMALLPWKCPIYRGRKSTLQVPNMQRGHMSANVTLLGGEGEGVEEGGRGRRRRRRRSTPQVPNMHKGQVSTNITLLGGEREGGGLGLGGGKGDQVCNSATCIKDKCPPM